MLYFQPCFADEEQYKNHLYNQIDHCTTETWAISREKAIFAVTDCHLTMSVKKGESYIVHTVFFLCHGHQWG